MKKRVRRALNFFAFNLLFFALYLNFIHKDKAPAMESVSPQNGAAINGTVSVDNQVKYMDNKTATINAVAEQQTVPVKTESSPAQN
ncbi:MAG TPA: hypothetical protein VHD35_06330 [Chitinophagaceae bacterium]|nr:hypothetical protein [Chitinophagaceae bacterium]